MAKKVSGEKGIQITRRQAINALVALRRAELASAHSGEVLGEYHRLVNPKIVRLVDGRHAYWRVPNGDEPDVRDRPE